jgi:2-keto-4-pentenoate hydratase/2-oxohepta-3-ene-1,7-dioic acid hydratase in catechol pathway
LLVIPRDLDAFYRELKLELWHNGVRKQLAEPQRMNWDVARILDESFAREDRTWRFEGRPVGLPIRNGEIPARTMILSGTPDGVLYVQPTRRQLFAGLSEMFFTLHWASPNRILEPYIREAQVSGRFLEPGDEVVMRADRLGVIVNQIITGDGNGASSQ